MHILATPFLFSVLSITQMALAFPGLHYHVRRAVAGQYAPSYTDARALVTSGPELREAHGRRAAQIVTISCAASTSCVAYDVSYSSITAFNPQQFTATSGNWCFGPGCVPISSSPHFSASGSRNSTQNISSSTPTQSPPFGNGTDTSSVPGPTAPNNSPAAANANSTNISSPVPQGPTAMGTGNSFSSSSGESAPFGNATNTASISAGPTAGTSVPVSSETKSSTNDTTESASSRGPTGFGTGTSVLSAGPTSSASSQGPFANSTDSSRPQGNPTGTAVSGTGISPEGTSTTIITSGTAVLVTTYTDEPWVAWTAVTVHSPDNATTTCTDSADLSDQPARNAAGAETSFKSTATVRFVDTTYTIPVPASYTSDVPSPDSPEPKAIPSLNAISAYPAPPHSVPIPTSHPSRSTRAASTSLHTPHISSSTTFDAVSWLTSSCYTTTFFDVTSLASRYSFVPTGSTGICYGIECNAASSCQDWQSAVPLAEVTGSSTAKGSSRAPYSNASTTALNSGTITRGGGSYPAKTGTGVVASSEITDNPWPASPNATRNSAAYTNTAGITLSALNSSLVSAKTSVDAVSSSTLFRTFTDDSGSTITSAYSTVVIGPAIQRQSRTAPGVSSKSELPVETQSAIPVHPWAAWTLTLETSTTAAATEDAVVASSVPEWDRDEETASVNRDWSMLHIMHNNIASGSKHKRAALRAKRTVQKREQSRQEKKYDTLLQKKRIEWDVEGKVEARAAEKSCCQGMSVHCWFVRPKAEGQC